MSFPIGDYLPLFFEELKNIDNYLVKTEEKTTKKTENKQSDTKSHQSESQLKTHSDAIKQAVQATKIINKTTNGSKEALGAELESVVKLTQSGIDVLAKIEETKVGLVTGLDLINLGISAGNVPNWVNNFKELTNQVNTSRESLQQLQNKQQTEGKDESLDQQILELENEIELLENEQKKMVINSAATIGQISLGQATSATNIADLVVAQTSHAAELLNVIGPSFGTLGGVVGVGVSAKGLAEDLQIDEVVSKKFEELEGLLQQTEQGSLLREIISIKLLQLEQQSQDLGVSLVRNYVGVISSTLGTAGSVGSIIIGTGVAVGVGGTALISASGIGAIVIGSLVCVGGTGYLLYRNKDVIANGVDTMGNYMHTEILDLQKQKIDLELTKNTETIKELETLIVREKVKLERQKRPIKVIANDIQRLNLTKAVLHKEIHDSEAKSDLSFLEEASEWSKRFSLKRAYDETDEKIKEAKGRFNRLIAREEKLTELIKAKTDIKDKHETQLQSLADLKGRITDLQVERALLQNQAEYISMAKNMKGYDSQGLEALENEFKEKITILLEGDSNALKPLSEFLESQGFDYEQEEFDKNPSKTILKYVTQEIEL